MKHMVSATSVMKPFVRSAFVLSLVALILSFSVSGQANAQNKQISLTNKSVIDMKANGVPSGIILRRITEATSVNFDLSDAGIGQLSKAGISEEIINKMMDKQNAAVTTGAGSEMPGTGTGPLTELKKLKSGIYIKDGGRYVEIEPTIFVGQKTSSWQRHVPGGVYWGKGTTTMTLNGKEANTSLDSKKPVFYFVFNESENSLNDQASGWMSKVSNPGEFSLIKIIAKKDKKTGKNISREVEVKADSYFAGREEGINQKFRVDFKRNKLDEGIYEVFFSEDLEPGEYGFMYAGAVIEYRRNHSKVYDFAVK